MEMFKEIIRHFTKLFKRFIPQCRLYGFSVAFWSFMFGFKQIYCNRLKLFFAVQKHKAILRYLSSRYFAVIDDYTKRAEPQKQNIAPESPIWVCWWDGEEAMPPLVKACYNSIKRHAGKHPVKLITKFNFREFVSIPEYILEKVEKKIMTLTHFSNILRVNLLHDHGGIWLDSTILVLKDIALDHLPFYTLKTTNKTYNVSHIPLQGHLYKFTEKKVPLVNNWSGFLLAGAKNSIVFAYMRDILYVYWKDHNDQIDYLLYDYTIAFGYGNIPCIKKIMDNVLCIDYDKNALEKIMNSEYSKEQFEQYSETFYKLTWKKKFNMHTKNNKLTVYGHLVS